MSNEKAIEKKKAFALRLQSKTMAALEKWAEDEFRSVNGQIEWILTEALKKEGRNPK
ncbi:MAG: Arc family DNA-binding protein [Bacteroidales bacterium]|nr:Arc family DNA-binding protein [Bacteroidales bacterium]